MPLRNLKTGPLLPGAYGAARDEYDRGLQGYMAQGQQARTAERDTINDQRYEQQSARQDRQDRHAQELSKYDREAKDQTRFWSDYDRMIGQLDTSNPTEMLSNYNKTLGSLKKRHPSMAAQIEAEEINLEGVAEEDVDQATEAAADQAAWKIRYALSAMGASVPGLKKTDLDKRIDLAYKVVQGDQEASQVLDLVSGGNKEENERILLSLIRGYYDEHGVGGRFEGEDTTLSEYVLTQMAELKPHLQKQTPVQLPQEGPSSPVQPDQAGVAPDWQSYLR